MRRRLGVWLPLAILTADAVSATFFGGDQHAFWPVWTSMTLILLTWVPPPKPKYKLWQMRTWQYWQEIGESARKAGGKET